jgi:hypothetical protein
MRSFGSLLLAIALAMGSTGWGLQAPAHTKRASAKSGSKRPAGKKSSSKKSSSKKSSSKKSSVRRQNEPDAERAREIQEALAREGYLTSKPSGKWDAATSDAFSRYQRDKALPVTGKPESRALIKLGLGGPNHTQ